jgi:hypothetical protein
VVISPEGKIMIAPEDMIVIDSSGRIVVISEKQIKIDSKGRMVVDPQDTVTIDSDGLITIIPEGKATIGDESAVTITSDNKVSMITREGEVFKAVEGVITISREKQITFISKEEMIDPMSLLKSSMGSLFGYAFARAGYLDYSAEFYANANFDKILTVNNIGKSIVNNTVPGNWFEDGRRIEHKIRDVYNPGAVGYQSDAIGAVGENYRLFGALYPLAVLMVSFIFACLFFMCKSSVIGLYAQYVLAMGLVSWWNSYGYDTLFIDLSRSLIFGTIVLGFVLFEWSKLKKYVP